MLTRNNLQAVVGKAIIAFNESGTIAELAKHIWNDFKSDLKASGDLFFTWQYDMRWAATRLREEGKIFMADVWPRGRWELAKS